MTVLVLDSPELIARAAAMEAANAKTDIQVKDARENSAPDGSSTQQHTFGKGTSLASPAKEPLALVV